MSILSHDPDALLSDAIEDLNIFFITGSVRSGTTLLRLLMGHHPDVSKCNEMEYVTPILLNSELRHSGHKSLQWLSLDRQFRNSGYTFNPDKPVDGQLRNFFHQLYELEPCRWVAATVHNEFHALPELFPNAKYIFIHRDPRDVARSCKHMGWNGTSWGASKFWLAGQSQLGLMKARVEAAQIKEIKFEELVADPESTLTSLCEFLNITFIPAMLDLEKDTTYSRAKTSEAANWRDKATVREIQEIESTITLGQLDAAGYPHSGYEHYQPTQLQRAILKLRDKTGKHKFQLKRYGMLHIAGLIARRIPHQGFRMWVSVRQEAITKRYLK